MKETGLLHDWWDPSIKYPNLALKDRDDNPILSCRRCSFIKTKTNAERASCPGIVHVELR